ncbi:hypothetical protein [Kocuria arenosa]|uniref:hypothetical protein n=1 Tax=Kocuria arenosa TaxID=3071446 RepID=UPI0034D62F03
MTLSDGHIYCKRSSGLKGYYCPPTFRHRVAVTEGNAMFTGWAAEAHDTECRYDLPHRTGSTLAARRPGRFGPLIGSC